MIDPRKSPLVVLGIETSCDETAAAVVRLEIADQTSPGGRLRRVKVMSNVVASQHELHAEYRGVVPEIASRAHAERLIPVVRRACSEAGIVLEEINIVAVGNKPGLVGSLLVGVAGAKGLAYALGVPCVPVDHVQAHLFAGLMSDTDGCRIDGESTRQQDESLGLVVSGGHTAIYLVHTPTEMTRIGWTIDDAVGEAYDKVAAILGLGFPGGQAVDKLAQSGNQHAVVFPISRLGRESLNFSFSGLKTAVLYGWNGVPAPTSPGIRPPRAVHVRPSREDLCASFQHAAVAALVMKLGVAVDRHPAVRRLLVGGGVSANSRLRSELAVFASSRGLELHLPSMDLCVDNAAMIAGLGGAAYLRGAGSIGRDLGFSAVPTGSAGG